MDVLLYYFIFVIFKDFKLIHSKFKKYLMIYISSKQARLNRIHSVLFHLYKVRKQEKLNYVFQHA